MSKLSHASSSVVLSVTSSVKLHPIHSHNSSATLLIVLLNLESVATARMMLIAPVSVQQFIFLFSCEVLVGFQRALKQGSLDGRYSSTSACTWCWWTVVRLKSYDVKAMKSLVQTPATKTVWQQVAIKEAVWTSLMPTIRPNVNEGTAS